LPKKTPEPQRDIVVSLRRGGATYTQIEADPRTVNPDTGKPLARPTLIKILKEAGLTKSASAASTTKNGASASTPSSSPSMPVHASSDGVSDFMPKTATKKAEPAGEPIDFECSVCGAEFVADSEADLPAACPECGH